MTDEIQQPEESGENMGTILLMLSLYLIVLAFFILLNAISESSQSKSDIVVESIMDGFSFRTTGESMYDDPVKDVDKPSYDHIAMDLKGIIEAYLSLQDYKFKHESTRMHVYIMANRLFEEGTMLLKPNMVGFMEDLSKLLKAQHYGLHIVSEIRVRSNTDGVYPAVEMAGRRAALLVRALEDRGVDKHLLSAVALLDNRDEVELYFEIVHVGDGEAYDTVKGLNTLVQEQQQEVRE